MFWAEGTVKAKVGAWERACSVHWVILVVCPYREQQEAAAIFPQPEPSQGRETGVRVVLTAPAAEYPNHGLITVCVLISISFLFDTQNISSCPLFCTLH